MAVSDNFNRANQNPIAAPGWTAPTRPTQTSGLLQLLNQELAAGTIVGGTSHAYYSALSFAANQGAQITCKVLPTSNQGISLTMRIKNPTVQGVTSFYQFSYHPGVGYRMFIVTNDNYSQIGGTIGSPAMVAGNKIRMEIIGSVLNGYVYRSGAWQQIMSVNNAVYPDGGFIGVEITDTQARVDDFYAYNIIVLPTNPNFVPLNKVSIIPATQKWVPLSPVTITPVNPNWVPLERVEAP